MVDAKLRLTPRYLSDVLWHQWTEALEAELPAARGQLSDAFEACEATRAEMDYKTGSISFAAGLLLYIATRNLRPSQVFEVGTFIGKSTVAMALAIDRNANGGRIFTCDGSNDFRLPQIAACDIVGFPKTRSTGALLELVTAGARLDFLHLDGRVSAQDLELVERLADPGVVIALDDFEGMEKGVANLMQIRGRPFFSRHLLIYPASDATLAKLGLVSRATTAFLLPASALVFASQ
jgi:predicted O-methyltransferase YrrM